LVAAVVLDPEATGMETDHFLRAVRSNSGSKRMPVVVWSADRNARAWRAKSGVATVVPKPMFLRLIQALDKACGLRMSSFRPHVGGLPPEEDNVRPQAADALRNPG
jgi:hypothetical protein